MPGVVIGGRALSLVRNIRQHRGHPCKTAGADVAADDADAIGPQGQDDMVNFQACRLQAEPTIAGSAPVGFGISSAADVSFPSAIRAAKG